MKKGFTLIELMIVVVIIGILAAIAIPKFADVSEAAKRNTCRANMRTIASQEAIYFAQNSSYTSNMGTLGMAGVQCPTMAVPTLYKFTGTTTTVFNIICPNTVTSSHGAISDGVASWINSD